MSARRIILLFVAAMLIVFGVNTIQRSQSGPGDITAVSGQLTCLEGAEDPDFGISVDGPILIRKVEMYQYVLEDQRTITTGFSERHEPEQRTELKTYSNPAFPDQPKATVFYGKVAIGDDGDEGLLLSDRILEKFSLPSYINFDSQYNKWPVNGVGAAGTVLGLEPLDEQTYATPGGEYWEVGDLKVTWYTVDPLELTGVFTAVGGVTDGVIGDAEHIIDIYDREISLEEVVDDFVSGNRTTGIVLLAVGAALAILAVVLPSKKKRAKRTAEK